MKKINLLLYIFNLLFGIILFINCYFLYNYTNLNIVLFIGLLIFEVVSLYLYIKRSHKYELIDYIVSTFYYVFLIVFMIFMMFYQQNYDFNYNMMYFSKYLFIPHFLYSLYNIF